MKILKKLLKEKIILKGILLKCNFILFLKGIDIGQISIPSTAVFPSTTLGL